MNFSMLSLVVLSQSSEKYPAIAQVVVWNKKKMKIKYAKTAGLAFQLTRIQLEFLFRSFILSAFFSII